MVSTNHTRKPARALGLVLTVVLLAGLLLGSAPLKGVRADSGIVFVGTPGTAAPPTTLGPYVMVPFAADGRQLFSHVTDVPGPTGDLFFDRGLEHDRIGTGWATWSHGYTGDVYDTGKSSQVTITLPAGTYAFYLYAEPVNFGLYSVTATAQDGTTSGAVSVDGEGGAQYFGFYSTGAALTSITVSSSEGFAVGEFGICSEAPVAPSSCTRADVAVVIYGGWDGIPVKAYVGGTEQKTLYTARDGFGNPAVLWTFYPGSGWPVSVAPQLPAGLDAARWQLKPVAIRTGSGHGAGGTGATIYPCSEVVFYFQLIDTGAK